MSIKTAARAHIAIAASGCASCHQHPIACTVAIVGAVAVGSLAAYEASRGDLRKSQSITAARPICSHGAC